jgi:hypothetical protein
MFSEMSIWNSPIDLINGATRSPFSETSFLAVVVTTYIAHSPVLGDDASRSAGLGIVSMP